MDLRAANLASSPPAEEARVGPWRLRRGRGGGRRASCATLEGSVEEGAAALAAALARIHGWGERPVFMVSGGEDDLDALLADHRLEEEGRTLLYAGAAAALAVSATDVMVIDCAGPIVVMRELWAEAGAGPERLAAMARVEEPQRYLLGRMSERPAGVAFVSVHGEWAILNALHVAPRFRRKGLGRRLAQGAAAWATAQGAARLALGVEEGNAVARALYERLGMAEAGRYHYRVGPATG